MSRSKGIYLGGYSTTALKAASRSKCPPHSPVIADSLPGGGYETKCLACGARRPKRETCVEAKQALDAVLGR